jgi:hypothetical protein
VDGRTIKIRSGKRHRLVVPTRGGPLVLHIGVVRSPLGARVLGVKIVSLRFVRA